MVDVSDVRERLPVGPVPAALLALAVVALALRLFDLGARVFYYDEAWFGYWVLRFVDSGVWSYRPILHGPFFARVNSAVFVLLGATDATARLVVAALGGLLPLSAWLFRERLRDVEVIALGAVLALNPILLYYSRFMRKDFPLAAFMLITLGLLVRLADTGRRRYLYGAAASLGLAFSTKESVLLWVATWLGAGALLVDYRLVRARDVGDAGPVAVLRGGVDGAAAALDRWLGPLLGAAGVFFAVVIYFYAPRAHGVAGPGLWKALTGQFGTLPTVVWQATGGAFEAAIQHWVGGSKQSHPYIPYALDTLRTLSAGAAGVVILSVVGFLGDRYGGDAPRDLVAFSFYGGVAAVLGYPLANNFPVPWSTVHAVVPLAIPAAVGAGYVYSWGTGEIDLGLLGPSREDLKAGAAAGLLLALALSAGLTAVQTSYLHPHESPEGPDGGNEIVYYAQAPGDLREGISAIREATASGGGDVDVLYVGASLTPPEGVSEAEIGGTGAWHARIPLPWYTEAMGSDVASVERAAAVTDPPPVVIASPDVADAVAARLDGYDRRRQPLDDVGDRTVVFFVRR